MTRAGDVLAGTLVFLDCGCAGIRGISPREGPVLVAVQRPCEDHSSDARLLLRYLEHWELVSPLTRVAGHGSP